MLPHPRIPTPTFFPVQLYREVETWDEASSRLVYVAHNLRRIDSGSLPHFGSVGVIFRTSSVRDLVEISSRGSASRMRPGCSRAIAEVSYRRDAVLQGSQWTKNPIPACADAGGGYLQKSVRQVVLRRCMCLQHVLSDGLQDTSDGTGPSVSRRCV